jgi:hypothetical protein
MRLICLTVTLTAVALAAGCGGGAVPTIPVNGVVTMDGKPLDNAAVTFYAEAGGIGGSARTGSDGKFVVTGGTGKSQGLAPGKYKVTVSKMKAMISEDQVGAVTDADIKNDLPAIYSNPQQTKLSFSVTGDGKPIEIALESKPK